MTLDEAITMVEKIDVGVRDHTTGHVRFDALWRHPFLREAFLDYLHACRQDCGHDYEYAQANFNNVCALLEPEFINIVTMIDHGVGAAIRSPIQTS
jgi:hypothetical protein